MNKLGKTFLTQANRGSSTSFPPTLPFSIGHSSDRSRDARRASTRSTTLRIYSAIEESISPEARSRLKAMLNSTSYGGTSTRRAGHIQPTFSMTSCRRSTTHGPTTKISLKEARCFHWRCKIIEIIWLLSTQERKCTAGHSSRIENKGRRNWEGDYCMGRGWTSSVGLSTLRKSWGSRRLYSESLREIHLWLACLSLSCSKIYQRAKNPK